MKRRPDPCLEWNSAHSLPEVKALRAFPVNLRIGTDTSNVPWRPMTRREAMAAMLVLAALPLPASPQPAVKPARIVILVYGARPAVPPPRSIFGIAFVQRLRELGYVEGRNISYETRWTLARAEDLSDLGREFALLRPDVILATGELSARAAQQLKTGIPIVLAYSGDPVLGGFAASLARPGGSITGVATLNEDTTGKLLELLLAVVPRRQRIAVLGNPSTPSYLSVLKNLQQAAREAGVALLPVEARSPDEIEQGFTRMAREKVRGAVILGDPLVFAQRQQLAELALKHQIASVYPAREHVEAGGLMSYGVDIVDGFRRAASFVDRILKGAKPGDLPIEQATTLELAINLKTAKALGLVIPLSVLIRADRVIE